MSRGGYYRTGMAPIRPSDQSWREHAACIDLWELMVPEGLTPPGTPLDWDTPRSICQECPVIDACLTDALNTRPKSMDDHGMRGGLTPDERRAIRRKKTNSRSTAA